MDFNIYRAPAGQTFTDHSNDLDAHVQSLTGLTGTKYRQFLQSKEGLDLVMSLTESRVKKNLKDMAGVGECHADSDCAWNEICMDGCTKAIYPEILLGNAFNGGYPLRQFSGPCRTDDDCLTNDPVTGIPRIGMKCNHNYKGEEREDIGMCQVQYDTGTGLRKYLKTPTGWIQPLNSELHQCDVSSDCGPSGINGWTRCELAGDGNKYCVWPGPIG